MRIESKKDDSIQLLRILMIMWVIAFHFADHGMVDMSEVGISANWIILAFCRIGGGAATVSLF